MYYYYGFALITEVMSLVQQLWWVLFFIKHQTIKIRHKYLKLRNSCSDCYWSTRTTTSRRNERRAIIIHHCYNNIHNLPNIHIQLRPEIIIISTSNNHYFRVNNRLFSLFGFFPIILSVCIYFFTVTNENSTSTTTKPTAVMSELVSKRNVKKIMIHGAFRAHKNVLRPVRRKTINKSDLFESSVAKLVDTTEKEGVKILVGAEEAVSGGDITLKNEDQFIVESQQAIMDQSDARIISIKIDKEKSLTFKQIRTNPKFKNALCGQSDDKNHAKIARIIDDITNGSYSDELARNYSYMSKAAEFFTQCNGISYTFTRIDSAANDVTLDISERRDGRYKCYGIGKSLHKHLKQVMNESMYDSKYKYPETNIRSTFSVNGINKEVNGLQRQSALVKSSGPGIVYLTIRDTQRHLEDKMAKFMGHIGCGGLIFHGDSTPCIPSISKLLSEADKLNQSIYEENHKIEVSIFLQKEGEIVCIGPNTKFLSISLGQTIESITYITRKTIENLESAKRAIRLQNRILSHCEDGPNSYELCRMKHVNLEESEPSDYLLPELANDAAEKFLYDEGLNLMDPIIDEFRKSHKLRENQCLVCKIYLYI